MDAEEGLGWTLDHAMRISAEYKKYLTLCLENPEAAVVPARDIDDFWHLHILDTRKYAEDCDKIFGSFLHHFPYFGMRGEEDARNLQKAWAESCNMYQQRFGEMDSELWTASGRCPNCGRKCSDDLSNQYMDEQRPRLALAA